MLKREEVASTSKTRLGFVKDEKYTSTLTVGFHGLEIPGREGKHAAGGENGLHDDGGEGTGG